MQIINEYGYAIIFLGTMAAGELVILAAVFLASLGLLNIYFVIIVCLLGTIISDNLWYYVGGKLNNRFGRLRSYFHGGAYHAKIISFKEKFNVNYKKFLVMSKFVYGVRVLTLLTSGYQRIPYKQFFIFNSLGTLLWLAIVVFLGYVMGVSWNYLSSYNNYARYYVLFGLLILFVLRYIFKKLINYNHYDKRS
ncbi:MAG: DedA family protein [Candidatus Buchananbacteria bacterium]|nr:DedA family protein [Candidatus Buchananbacteria bacterium]